MSHEDSLDEETKRLLAEVDSYDSKESPIPDKKKEVPKDDEHNKYEYSDNLDDDDSQW